MTKEKRASLLVILAGMFWGVLGVFIRRLAAIGFDTLQIAFIRMFFAFILFFAYLLIFDKSKLKISFKDIWMFICTGLVCIFLHNITYFYAVINGEASVAIILVYTSPIWIMLVSAIVFREKITKRKIVALIITFTGCLFVSGVIGGKISTPLSVVVVGVLSGFLYGMYSIFSKIAFRKYSSETINMYTFLFAFVGSVFVNDVPETLSLMMASASNFFVTLGASVICCLIPFFLYTKGLRDIDAGKAAILVAMDPIVSSAMGFLVLGDDFTILKLLGIVFVISSIVILNTEKET